MGSQELTRPRRTRSGAWVWNLLDAVDYPQRRLSSIATVLLELCAALSADELYADVYNDVRAVDACPSILRLSMVRKPFFVRRALDGWTRTSILQLSSRVQRSPRRTAWTMRARIYLNRATSGTFSRFLRHFATDALIRLQALSPAAASPLSMPTPNSFTAGSSSGGRRSKPPR
jgi:hypothetical protein